jgi:AdoMet-dependent rRNA methyltransferase SPB1
MNAKFKAKRAREEVEEWNGLETEKTAADKSASDSDSDSEEDDNDNPVDSLLTSLGPRLDARSKGKLSKRAALFFDQPDFEGIDLDEETAAPEEHSDPVEQEPPAEETIEEELVEEDMEDSASENGFEIVPTTQPNQESWNDDSDDEKPPAKPSPPTPLRN